MRFMPKKMRHSMFRKSINLDFRKSPDVTFKVAESKEELEQAFKLVYQVHFQKNLVASHVSEMKLSKIHALPTTKVLIAVKKDKVVSVLCLSLESPLRTSCEEQFDLSSLKTQDKCFVEVSGFVYDTQSVEDYKAYLIPLCKLGLELNKIYLKADYLVVALDAEDFDYWSALFLIDKISEKVVRFQEFNGRLAVCAFADIGKLEEKFLFRYGRKKVQSNLHKYLFTQVDPRLQIPSATELVRQKYTPQILNYFFNIKTNIFAQLTTFETRTIHKIYDDADYSEILPIVGFRTKYENQRNAKRHHAHLTGKIKSENSDLSVYLITIKTVSLYGVGAVCAHKLTTDLTYKLTIDIGEKMQIELLASPVWSSRDQTYGFVIRSQSPQWVSFIENFSNDVKKAS